MNLFTAYTRRDIASRFALVALGAVLGASLSVMLLSHETDRLTLENADLMDQIEYLTNRVALLSNRGPGSHPYVEAVEIIASGVNDRTRSSVEQNLKEVLRHLIGEEIHRVNPGTIHQAIEGPIRIDGQEYAVEVDTIYVAPTVRVHVRVRSRGTSTSE